MRPRLPQWTRFPIRLRRRRQAAEIAEPKLTDADVHQLISKAGASHNLDVDLLASVVRAESGGNIHAVSRTGAQGLMQLMPGTAAELGVADSFRADQNINGGTAYLDALAGEVSRQSGPGAGGL